jgi:hypothetical protein
MFADIKYLRIFVEKIKTNKLKSRNYEKSKI